MKVNIISIGPGDPDLLNEITKNLLKGPDLLIMRTIKHPLAEWLRKRERQFVSMDSLYETIGDFDQLYSSIADDVWKIAAAEDHVIYAVPDVMADRSVDEVIRKKPESADVSVIPGFSYADYYLTACRGLLPSGNVHICSAVEFLCSCHDPDQSLLITEINDEILAGEVKNHLACFLDDEDVIIFMDENATVRQIYLYELDRQKTYSHLTAVAVKGCPYQERHKKTFCDLLNIMDLLRSPDGCPWDRRQTHKSLAPYLIEEAWETVETIEKEDYVHLSEELGDMLFQIAFHTSIGTSFDEFSFNDITTGICDKMIRRHPHVFRKEEYGTDSFTSASWNRIKQEENGTDSLADALKRISPGLPSLRYADKALRLLESETGIERHAEEILYSIESLSQSLLKSKENENAEMNLGKLLFLCAALLRCYDADGEVALHQTVNRIIKTCESFEKSGKIRSKAPERLTFKDLGVY